MLSNSANIITPVLTRIFNILFSKSIFPLEWTKAFLTPVHKKGDKFVCSNYRGISLTSLLSKVYTGVLTKRLTLFSDKIDIVPEEQGGFRAGYSTIDHIFSLYAMITKPKIVRGVYRLPNLL